MGGGKEFSGLREFLFELLVVLHDIVVGFGGLRFPKMNANFERLGFLLLRLSFYMFRACLDFLAGGINSNSNYKLKWMKINKHGRKSFKLSGEL